MYMSYNVRTQMSKPIIYFGDWPRLEQDNDDDYVIRSYSEWIYYDDPPELGSVS